MKLLDLFCGEGLAAWGYWQSGRFSEIVGVDIDPQMSTRYAFDFICADCRVLTYDFLLQFDFIHASPPCQAYSKMTPNPEKHPRLIAATHLMCAAAGVPYVIENVEGSGQELRPNVRLYGRDVGLVMDRPRYFHVSAFIDAHMRQTHVAHMRKMIIDRRINVSAGAHVHIHGGDYVSRGELIEVFGLRTIPEQRLKRLTRTGIEQGIPPAFTRLIAETVIPRKFLIA